MGVGDGREREAQREGEGGKRNTCVKLSLYYFFFSNGSTPGRGKAEYGGLSLQSARLGYSTVISGVSASEKEEKATQHNTAFVSSSSSQPELSAPPPPQQQTCIPAVFR